MTKRSFAGTERLLLVDEVAEDCRVSKKTILRAIQSGELTAISIGRGYRITQSEVRRFLKRRTLRKS